LKNDGKAIKFLEWYSTKYIEEHKNPYPNFMKKILQFKNRYKKLPEIKIMIRASDRYKEDINQQIKVNLSQKKLRSKEEVDIEIKRQSSVFLEIINKKRNEKNEPKVKKNQIIASAYFDIEDDKYIVVWHAAKIYIPIIKRLVQDSRNKIKELKDKTV